MGLFSYFKRRRERESVVSAEELAALSNPHDEAPPRAPAPTPAQDTDSPVELQVNLGGNVDLGSLMGMVFKALTTGTTQVSQTETQDVDLRGTGLRDEILEALRASGVDPQGAPAQIDASAIPGLQERIREALAERGVEDPGPSGIRITVSEDAADERQPEDPGAEPPHAG